MKRFRVPLRFLLAFGLSLSVAGSIPAQAPELERISSEAVGFVHIRVADLWRHDAFKDFRQVLEKAGPQALKVLEQRFVPAPSTVERGTFVFFVVPGQPPAMALIVRTTAEFDPFQLVQRNMPNAQAGQVGRLTVHVDRDSRSALTVFDTRTFAVGTTEGVRLLAQAPAGGPSKLASAMELAKTRLIVAGIQPSRLKALLQGAAPPPVAPILEAETLLASLDLGAKPRFDMQLRFSSPEQATAGEQALRNGLKFLEAGLAQGRTQVESQLFSPEKSQPASWEALPETAAAVLGLGMVTQMQEALRALPLQREGNIVRTTLDLPAGDAGNAVLLTSVTAGMLIPAVQKVREAANRMRGMNNLKQMALAMHNYHDTFGHFPAAAICDKQGKPLLSWRVAVLPFLEQEALYKQFKLDQPWDSPHNIQLLKQMPKVYFREGVSRDGDTQTYYRVFTGRQAPFDLRKGRRIADFTDGTSNTLLIVEAAQSVPWTRPEELEYDPMKPIPALGRFSANGSVVGFADGSVRFLSATINEQTLRALITHNGGEIVNLP